MVTATLKFLLMYVESEIIRFLHLQLDARKTNIPLQKKQK